MGMNVSRVPFQSKKNTSKEEEEGGRRHPFRPIFLSSLFSLGNHERGLSPLSIFPPLFFLLLWLLFWRGTHTCFPPISATSFSMHGCLFLCHIFSLPSPIPGGLSILIAHLSAIPERKEKNLDSPTLSSATWRVISWTLEANKSLALRAKYSVESEAKESQKAYSFS